MEEIKQASDGESINQGFSYVEASLMDIRRALDMKQNSFDMEKIPHRKEIEECVMDAMKALDEHRDYVVKQYESVDPTNPTLEELKNLRNKLNRKIASLKKATLEEEPREIKIQHKGNTVLLKIKNFNITVIGYNFADRTDPLVLKCNSKEECEEAISKIRSDIRNS